MSDAPIADSSDCRSRPSGTPEFEPMLVDAASAATTADLHSLHGGYQREFGDTTEPHQQFAGELGQLQLDALLGRTELGIAACNAAGELTFLSPALQQLMGRPFEPHSEAEQVERYRLYESDGSTELQPAAVPLARARNGEVVTDQLICARSPTGSLIYLLCSALPVTCPDGSLAGAVVFAQDVTGEHAARQDQEHVHERLVVTLNHEFRTPLTKLVGYAEILQDLSDDLPTDAARYLGKIRQAAEELTGLVDSVTELADLHTSSRHGDTFRDCATPSRQEIQRPYAAGHELTSVGVETPCSDELLRWIMGSTTDGLWIFDDRGITTFANPRMAYLLGRSPEEMPGFAVTAALDSDGQAQFLAHLDALRTTGLAADNLECSFLRPDGSRIWTVASHTPLLDENGVRRGWLHRVTELADRKLSLDKAATTEQQLAEAQSIAKVGSWEWDVRHDVVTWSDQLFRIYELAPQELEASYEGFLGYLHPEDRPMVEEAVGAAFAGADTFDFDARIVKSSGRVGWIRGQGRVIRDESGAPIRMGGTSQEITEAVQTARELAAARDEAVEASRLKSEFLATMSHEIRTPLNGVIGLTDLLRRTELDLAQHQLATGISQAGRTLLGLLNDILDLSKIEAGKLELEVVDFEVREVVDQVTALAAGAGSDEDVDLVVSYDDEVPSVLRGDPVRFGQVVTNLVSNALKFTQHGHVIVRVGREADKATCSTLRVEVTDTGIGIARAAQDTLFESFTQADASTTRQYGGTGLGLNISRRLVQALGGDIAFSSQEGVGTTFWFTAPFEPPVAVSADRTVPPGVVRAEPFVAPLGAGGTVLVAEDNDVNRLVAKGMVEGLGYAAEFAHDGEQARAQVAASPDRFVAVLMDCQMPRMDGYAATRAIRRREAPGSRLPIIAMTASVAFGEEERCLAAGMDDFMVKPVDFERLGVVLERWTAHTPAGTNWRVQPHSVDVLDLERIIMLEQLRPGDHSLFAQFVDSFAAHAPNAAAAIHEALKDGDDGRLEEAAHLLKGSAQNLGAAAVGRLCTELEDAARLQDLDSARHAGSQLDEVVRVAVRALHDRLTVPRHTG